MDEKLLAIGEAILGGLPGSATGFEISYGELNVTAKAADILKVVRFLRDDPRCQFWNFIDVTAVDWPQREQRFRDGLAERVERFVHDVLQRSIVPIRRIFFCSSSTP